MKKSNIIVIVLASFIVTSLLIFYIDGKNHTDKKNTNVWKEKTIPSDISVIIAEDEADVHIFQSDTAKLKIEVLKDSAKKTVNFKISNDTLHIYKGNRVFVYNKNTTSVIAKKAFWVGVQFTKIDSMNFNVSDTKWFVINDESKKCYANKLLLSANKNENIHLNGNLTIENLVIDANESNVKVYDQIINKVDARTINKSSLIFYTTNIKSDFVIKKDSTSIFNSYN